MHSLWPEAFPQDDATSAKSLFEEQAAILPKITENLVWAEVKTVEPHQMPAFLTTDFAFRFDIFGKALSNYRFTALYFGHDITLYPVKFIFDEALSREIRPNASPLVPQAVNDQHHLEYLVKQVLNSQRVNSVVGSIIRMSRD